VSAPDKPDLHRGAMFLRKLVLDDQARRATLTDEERLAEDARDEALYAGEDDARPVPSAEEIIARVMAKAERQRIAAAAVASGVPAGEGPTASVSNGHVAGEAPVAPKTPAKVVPIRSPWPRIMAGLSAAAVIVIIGGFVMNQEPIVGRPPPWTPHDGAEQLRRDADSFCTVGDWAQCKSHLDRAAALDPAGEAEGQVKRMRAEIATGGSKQPAPGKSGP
jgi:hypothetical protein